MKAKDKNNWSCNLVEDSSAETDIEDNQHCYCSFEYDCSENEQFYFDLDTEEENLEDFDTIRKYEQKCEQDIAKLTNTSWNCTVMIEDHDPDNRDLDYSNSYCDCFTTKKCEVHKLLKISDYIKFRNFK